jgi:hypothetical protein
MFIICTPTRAVCPDHTNWLYPPTCCIPLLPPPILHLLLDGSASAVHEHLRAFFVCVWARIAASVISTCFQHWHSACSPLLNFIFEPCLSIFLARIPMSRLGLPALVHMHQHYQEDLAFHVLFSSEIHLCTVCSCLNNAEGPKGWGTLSYGSVYQFLYNLMHFTG